MSEHQDKQFFDEFTHREPKTPEGGWKQFISQPVVSPDGAAQVIDCLMESQISSRNRYVEQMSENLKSVYKLPTAYVYSNGYSTLVIAMKIAKVGQGDEVIIPTFTMSAVATSVMDAGATPVLVDCAENNMNPSVNQIEKVITNKTKAIIVCHIYGCPMDMEKFSALCQSRNLILIEDISEAIGCKYKGQYLGSFGDYGCSSLYANKLISAGEGGFLISKHSLSQDILYQYACHGFQPNYHFLHKIKCGNYKVSGLAAALAANEPLKIEEYGKKREWINELYLQELSCLKNTISFVSQFSTEFGPSRPWVFGILLGQNQGQYKVKQIRDLLAEKYQIETRPFFRPMHRQPFMQEAYSYTSHYISQFPHSDALCQRGFYLPTHNLLEEADIMYISGALKEICLDKSLEDTKLSKTIHRQASKPFFKAINDSLRLKILAEQMQNLINSNLVGDFETAYYFTLQLLTKIKFYLRTNNPIIGDEVKVLIGEYRSEHANILNSYKEFGSLDLENSIKDFESYYAFCQNSAIEKYIIEQDNKQFEQNTILVQNIQTTSQNDILKFLTDYFRMHSNGDHSTVEIGSYYGASTVSILQGLLGSNDGNKFLGTLYCYDIFQKQNWMEKFMNHEQSSSNSCFLEQFQQNVRKFLEGAASHVNNLITEDLLDQFSVMTVKCQLGQDLDDFLPSHDKRPNMKKIQTLVIDAGTSKGFAQQVLTYFKEKIDHQTRVIILNFRNQNSQGLRKYFCKKDSSPLFTFSPLYYYSNNVIVMQIIGIQDQSLQLTENDNQQQSQQQQIFKNQVIKEVLQANDQYEILINNFEERIVLASGQNYRLYQQRLSDAVQPEYFKVQKYWFHSFYYTIRNSIEFIFELNSQEKKMQVLGDASKTYVQDIYIQPLAEEIRRVHSIEYKEQEYVSALHSQRIKPLEALQANIQQLLRKLCWERELFLLDLKTFTQLKNLMLQTVDACIKNLKRNENLSLCHGNLCFDSIIANQDAETISKPMLKLINWDKFFFGHRYQDLYAASKLMKTSQSQSFLSHYFEGSDVNFIKQEAQPQLILHGIIVEIEELFEQWLNFIPLATVVSESIKKTGGTFALQREGSDEFAHLRAREKIRVCLTDLNNILLLNNKAQTIPFECSVLYLPKSLTDRLSELLEQIHTSLYKYIDFKEMKKLNFHASTWDFHCGGWGYVDGLMKQYFHKENAPIHFISAVEEQCWAGFLHNIPQSQLQAQILSDQPQQYYLQNDLQLLQQKGLHTQCQSFFMLYSKMKSIINQEFPNLHAIPKSVICYPASPPQHLFQINKFLDNYALNKPEIYFIGEFQRNFDEFIRLDAPKFIKIILKKKLDQQYQQRLSQSPSEIKLCNEYIPNEQYELLLTQGLGILFLSMYDAGGTTVVIEAIARNVPIILNRLSSHEEYLGAGYPLFYDTLEQAEKILNNSSLIAEAYTYLKNMNKTLLYPQHFLEKFSRTSFFCTLPDQSKPFAVSIVLINYKRTQHLSTILDALLAQDFTLPFEIFLWNNNLETAAQFSEIAAVYRKKFNYLRFISSSDNFYCIVRQGLASLVQSDLMLIIDDDVIPEPTIISTFYNKYQQECSFNQNTVLCIRGVRFKDDKSHKNFSSNPGQVWQQYEGIDFYDEKQEEVELHFFHADCCLIPTNLMKMSLSYDFPIRSFALVDDYWYSYIFAHKFGARLLKIRGDNIMKDTELAHAEMALHKSPKVQEQRVRMYAYHMSQRWPPFSDEAQHNLYQQSLPLSSTTISNSIHPQTSLLQIQKCAIWKKGLAGVNAGYNLTRTDIQFALKQGIRVFRLGTVNKGQEIQSIDENSFDFKLNADKYIDSLKQYVEIFGKAGAYVVLVFTNLPGCFFNASEEKVVKIFSDERLAEKFCLFWKKLASTFARCPYVIGYDILNEPRECNENQLASFYKRVIGNIKAYDCQTPIILESSDDASCTTIQSLLSDKELAKDEQIFFSFHFYQPFQLTSGQESEKFQYPGPIPEHYTPKFISQEILQWNDKRLGEIFQSLQKQVKDSKISIHRIVLGEFGIKRFAKGALQYLTDIFSLLRETNFSWFIYSFREIQWNAMNYEYGTEKNQRSRQTSNNQLFDLVLQNIVQKCHDLDNTLINVEEEFLRNDHNSYEQFRFDHIQYNPNFFRADVPVMSLEEKGDYLALDYFGAKFFSSENKKKMPVIYVIGCGRSGTSLITQILSLFEGVCALNEPRSIWISMSEIFDIWSPLALKRNGTLLIQENSIQEQQILANQEKLYSIYARLCQLTHAHTLVEKQPEHAFKLKLLYKMFPNAKFINMYRNKQKTIESICRQGEDWYGKDGYKWKVLKAELDANHAELIKDSYETLQCKAEIEYELSSAKIREFQGFLKQRMVNDSQVMISIGLEELIQDPIKYIKICESFLNCKCKKINQAAQLIKK